MRKRPRNAAAGEIRAFPDESHQAPVGIAGQLSSGRFRHLGPPRASRGCCALGRGGCCTRTRSPLSHGASPVAVCCAHGVGPDQNVMEEPRAERGEDVVSCRTGLKPVFQTLTTDAPPPPRRTYYDPGTTGLTGRRGLGGASRAVARTDWLHHIPTNAQLSSASAVPWPPTPNGKARACGR